METQMGKKPQNVFRLLNKDYIHSFYQHQMRGGYNPLALSAPTGRKHQIHIFILQEH